MMNLATWILFDLFYIHGDKVLFIRYLFQIVIFNWKFVTNLNSIM